MSGHSKWSTIKHKKGAADKKRGILFSKLSRAIIVAAKEGGGDPDANIALQNAIEKARAVSMPKDNIERAIARGAGAGEGGEQYDTVSYEGYGPGGAALIVEGLTDNRNRTAADVRFLFSKFGGSLGAPGSVAWMFERKGVVAGARRGRRGRGDPRGRRGRRRGRARRRRRLAGRVRSGRPRRGAPGAQDAGMAVDSAELAMLPKNLVDVEEDQARSLLRLVDALEENDDVQDVFFNFDIPEAVLEEVSVVQQRPRVERLDRDDPQPRQGHREGPDVVLEVEQLGALLDQLCERGRDQLAEAEDADAAAGPQEAARGGRRTRRRGSPAARRRCRARRARRASAGSRGRRPSRPPARSAARAGSRSPSAPGRTAWGRRAWR